MTPGARARAAIELLAAIGAAEGPADRLLAAHFRGNRYIGSKDRNAIREIVYGVLRHRAQIDWWIERQGEPGPVSEPDPGPGPDLNRQRVLAALAMIERWPAAEAEAAFDGGQYRPGKLSEAEVRLFGGLAGAALDHPDQPGWVRGNYPEWLGAELEGGLGARVAEEMAAMARPAPVDLRVNTLKGSREEARAALAAEGVETAPTPHSPIGLRLEGRRTLPGLAAFRQGLVEVQDEGSPIVALLVDALPGQIVADYCAGAGGKTLALAAAMENRGRLVACDIAEARMRDLRPRTRRAGVSNVEARIIPEVGADGLDAEAFERVLVDVPCSGAGAWRRNPDAKWRLTQEELAAHAGRQQAILDRAARLVAPGGRLIYATCSVLDCENRQQVDRFLAAHEAFALLPAPDLWLEILGGDGPFPGPCLELLPGRDGTDGFFAAFLERRR